MRPAQKKRSKKAGLGPGSLIHIGNEYAAILSQEEMAVKTPSSK